VISSYSLSSKKLIFKNKFVSVCESHLDKNDTTWRCIFDVDRNPIRVPHENGNKLFNQILSFPPSDIGGRMSASSSNPHRTSDNSSVNGSVESETPRRRPRRSSAPPGSKFLIKENINFWIEILFWLIKTNFV
jgi:hypothetical protein